MIFAPGTELQRVNLPSRKFVSVNFKDIMFEILLKIILEQGGAFSLLQLPEWGLWLEGTFVFWCAIRFLFPEATLDKTCLSNATGRTSLSN